MLCERTKSILYLTFGYLLFLPYQLKQIGLSWVFCNWKMIGQSLSLKNKYHLILKETLIFAPWYQQLLFPTSDYYVCANSIYQTICFADRNIKDVRKRKQISAERWKIKFDFSKQAVMLQGYHNWGISFQCLLWCSQFGVYNSIKTPSYIYAHEDGGQNLRRSTKRSCLCHVPSISVSMWFLLAPFYTLDS